MNLSKRAWHNFVKHCMDLHTLHIFSAALKRPAKRVATEVQSSQGSVSRVWRRDHRVPLVRSGGFITREQTHVSRQQRKCAHKQEIINLVSCKSMLLMLPSLRHKSIDLTHECVWHSVENKENWSFAVLGATFSQLFHPSSRWPILYTIVTTVLE